MDSPGQPATVPQNTSTSSRANGATRVSSARDQSSHSQGSPTLSSHSQPNAASANSATQSTRSNAPTSSQSTTGSTSTQQQTSSNTAQTNSFLPVTRARTRENNAHQVIYDINKISIQPALTAQTARFSPTTLTEMEYSALYDLLHENPTLCNFYLSVRDRILGLWNDKVQTSVSRDDVHSGINHIPSLGISRDLRETLVNRTYDLLERTGRINYGIFEKLSCNDANRRDLLDRSKRAAHLALHQYKPTFKEPGTKNGRVIVIGAGLSGLMAARQLQKFGMEVIVLEARNRTGGRVHTYRKGNFVGDAGPNCLNGLIGNPLMTLGKQIELYVTELKQKIPVYENKLDKNGQASCDQVDTFFQKALDQEYNKIIEGTRQLKNAYHVQKYHGQPYPVGMAVDWVMKLQEKNLKDEVSKHLEATKNLYQQLIDSANKKLEKTRTIKKLHGELCSIEDSSDLGNHKDKAAIDTFNARYLARELDIAIREFHLIEANEKKVRERIEELCRQPPSDTYLTVSDRRLLDWHFAELEYALGCPINKLSINYEDDEVIFAGNHWMLMHGFCSITDALKSDLDVHLNTAVKKITVKKNCCKVLTYHPEQANSQYSEMTADAVLCTLPLGALQDSIVASSQFAANPQNFENQKIPGKGYQPVIFDPPLPKWKTQAFEMLGCANLNKIIMHFEKSFWNNEVHLFGNVDHRAMARGEFFLFWHYGRAPTLTALISGEAADMIEKLPDFEVLERCLDVLKSIFGNSVVTQPKDYIITKWRKDPWARGAWSYMQTGATGECYDICSEPVVLDSREAQFKDTKITTFNVDGKVKNPLCKRIQPNEDIPRLFFAGEHTSRQHFASAHGAAITGLREAARIANVFLGCPYDDKSESGIFMHTIS